MPTDQAALKATLRQSIAQAEAQLAALEVRYNVKTTTDTYAGEYEDARADYWTDIYESAYDYLNSSGAMTRYKNAARRSVVTNFPIAFYSGHADAGGEETEDEDESWLTGRMNKELEFVDSLFASLRELRKSEDFDKDDADAQASEKADGYRATLNSVYNEGKLRGVKGRLLEWHYGDTDHCDTCSELNGTKHKAQWYIDNNYIPGKPGAAMLCKGYKCQCFLTDKDGNEFSI